MSYSKSGTSDREYRDAMQGPMEDLAVALWGVGEDGPVGSAHWLDYQIVEDAARKITMLKAMLVSTGFNAGLLKNVMES